jgi:hypothetical protein
MPFKNLETERQYQHAHYLANKDKYIASANASRAARQIEFREIIRKAKDVPCTDCNVKYPYYVMQFDHRGDKEFTIANYPVTRSFKKLHSEIEKCDVVCANCHAERTHQQRQQGLK